MGIKHSVKVIKYTQERATILKQIANKLPRTLVAFDYGKHFKFYFKGDTYVVDYYHQEIVIIKFKN